MRLCRTPTLLRHVSCMAVWSSLGSKWVGMCFPFNRGAILGGDIFRCACFNRGFEWFLIVMCNLVYVMSIVVVTLPSVHFQRVLGNFSLITIAPIDLIYSKSCQIYLFL